jgi:hypothetical protein
MAYTNDLAAWKFIPFADSHEIQEAFRNPLYASSEAFRQAVAFKLSVSPDNIGGQGQVDNRPNVIHVPTPGSNTIHELPPEDATGFSEVATPAELQKFVDERGYLAMNPELKITPRDKTPEAAPTPPSQFSDEKLQQMVRDKNEREAASAAAKEQRMQDLRDERSRMVDERNRLNEELGL